MAREILISNIAVQAMQVHEQAAVGSRARNGPARVLLRHGVAAHIGHQRQRERRLFNKDQADGAPKSPSQTAEKLPRFP